MLHLKAQKTWNFDINDIRTALNKNKSSLNQYSNQIELTVSIWYVYLSVRHGSNRAKTDKEYMMKKCMSI